MKPPGGIAARLRLNVSCVAGEVGKRKRSDVPIFMVALRSASARRLVCRATHHRRSRRMLRGHAADLCGAGAADPATGTATRTRPIVRAIALQATAQNAEKAKPARK